MRYGQAGTAELQDQGCRGEGTQKVCRWPMNRRVRRSRTCARLASARGPSVVFGVCSRARFLGSCRLMTGPKGLVVATNRGGVAHQWSPVDGAVVLARTRLVNDGKAGLQAVGSPIWVAAALGGVRVGVVAGVRL